MLSGISCHWCGREKLVATQRVYKTRQVGRCLIHWTCSLLYEYSVLSSPHLLSFTHRTCMVDSEWNVTTHHLSLDYWFSSFSPLKTGFPCLLEKSQSVGKGKVSINILWERCAQWLEHSDWLRVSHVLSKGRIQFSWTGQWKCLLISYWEGESEMGEMVEKRKIGQ